MRLIYSCYTVVMGGQKADNHHRVQSDAAYYVQWRYRGKLHLKTTGTRSVRAARRIRDEMLALEQAMWGQNLNSPGIRIRIPASTACCDALPRQC